MIETTYRDAVPGQLFEFRHVDNICSDGRFKLSLFVANSLV